jgi:hypothetical protein
MNYSLGYSLVANNPATIGSEVLVLMLDGNILTLDGNILTFE